MRGVRTEWLESFLVTETVIIPQDLKPLDGRFGSGPSKIRDEAVRALASASAGLLGTSHRRVGVRSIMGRVREGLQQLFDLPDGYEVVLGNGGSTAFWDAMAFGLIERRSHHYVFGEFSSKCAAAAAAPHLAAPVRIESDPGTHPGFEEVSGVDLHALTHNETSTGVAMPVVRDPHSGLVAVDATSAAGGMPVDPSQFDLYYFAPQKCFASDGGLWIALCSPAALDRIERIHASDRYIPASLDLQIALDNSRKNQTYNTPALATLFLLDHQIQWMLEEGGLEWAAARSARSSGVLYDWAERHPVAEPYVKDAEQRSPVVVTIDFAAEIDAARVAATLRANGILDTEPYRKLGRNQLRIAAYPAIDPDDVARLARSIDFVIDALTG